MSFFSSLPALLGLAPQPAAIVSEIVAEAPQPAAEQLSCPLDAACDAFLAAGGEQGYVDLRSCMAAAFAAAARANIAGVIPVTGRGRQRRRRRTKLAGLGQRVLSAIARRA